jgi:Holliday junction resolvase-like predicted endonuclease
MTEQIEVEPLGEHDYLVRAHHSAGVVESRFRASAQVLEQIGASQADEQRVIEHSAAYLLAHQPVIDLPPMIDLDDMAAAFDDYLTRLRQAITGP